MKVVSSRRPEGWIELTPLIDVLFILLVFVLLTTSFANQRSMSVTFIRASLISPSAQPRASVRHSAPPYPRDRQRLPG